MRFTKMHGLSNDFVVVQGRWDPDPDRIRDICDRRRGVGADGLLTVEVSDGVVVMGYWNADGSPAEMCGNGLRCVARYAVDRCLVSAESFVVQTPVGPRRVRVGSDEVTVEVGRVVHAGEAEVDGYRLALVDVGNPHAVAFVADPDDVPLEELGPRIGRHPMFPAGTNVEFVTVVDAHRLRMRVWERGVGETPACGSGMVAAAAAARRYRDTGETVEVRVPGGVGRVSFEGDTAWLTGPAVAVFEGDWPRSF